MKSMLIFDGLAGCDGSKWGLSDWYDDREAALQEAIFKEGDFDTGWYGSKKEIVSGKVTRKGNVYTCSASCSDDFDTMGQGECSFELGPAERDRSLIDRIRAGLDAAWAEAEENRKDNQCYRGYSVGYNDGEGKRKDWIWTYLQRAGDALEFCFDEPPGDNYHEWGWQYGGVNPDEDKLTTEEREQMEAWIESYDRKERAVFGRWVIDKWD